MQILFCTPTKNNKSNMQENDEALTSKALSNTSQEVTDPKKLSSMWKTIQAIVACSRFIEPQTGLHFY